MPRLAQDESQPSALGTQRSFQWEPTIAWAGDLPGSVRLIDQTLLPGTYKVITCRTLPPLREAIQRLRVRGAPALGAAAALGVVLGLQRTKARTWPAFEKELARVAEAIGSARPTAVNLFWGLDRMRRAARRHRALPVDQILGSLLNEARAVLEEDRQVCRRMAAFGASLLSDGSRILTHCNTGALAAVDYGTALGAVFRAAEEGKRVSVIADETRPLLQGARLTCWELARAGIPATLICDNTAAQVMREGRVDLVLVGADRIAANGDTANKIGTYGVAVLAKAHRIPFYVVAPVSTIDSAAATGAAIPIEQRRPEEVTCLPRPIPHASARRRQAHPGGRPIAPEGTRVYNPAFDVTPADLIAGIVTDQGILRPPYAAAIKRLMRTSRAR